MDQNKPKVEGVINAMVGLIATIVFTCLILGALSFYVIDKLKVIDTGVLAILAIAFFACIVGAVVMSNVTNLFMTKKTIDTVTKPMTERQDQMMGAIVGLAQTVQEQQKFFVGYAMGQQLPAPNALKLSAGKTEPQAWLGSFEQPEKRTIRAIIPNENGHGQQIVEYDRDLLEHFILDQWPAVSRDRHWRRDKYNFTPTARFLASLENSPLEENALGHYEWREGIERDDVVSWYEEQTGLKVESAPLQG